MSDHHEAGHHGQTRAASMISCDECVEITSARWDGEASPPEARRAELHLGRCVRCRSDVERMTRLAGGVRVDGGKDTALTAPDLVGRVLAGLGGSGLRDDSAECCTEGLHVVGVAPCGCSPGCTCGCQSGSSCRCGHAVA